MSGERPLLKFVAFSAVCIAFAVWLIVTIGNIALFADRASYEAEFADVTGLVRNDAVKVAGVDVGKVESIHVERGRAVVRFTLDESIELGETTTVGVRWRNLLGLRYLYVYPSGEGEIEAGHRFPIERTLQVADFGLLMKRLTPVFRSLDPEVGNVVVRALNEAISGREDRIQALIAEAGDLTNTLADRDEQIGRILANGAELASAYAERKEALRSLLESFADVSDTLAARNDEIERIVVDLAAATDELARFVDANDEQIRGSIDELDVITSILSENEDQLELIATYMGRGLAFYHRTSRWGQWFNIRVVGSSHAGDNEHGERGADLPEPDEEEGEGGGAAGFLRAGLRQPLSADSPGGVR